MRLDSSLVALGLFSACSDPVAGPPASPRPADTDAPIDDNASAPPFANRDSCLADWPDGEVGQGEEGFEPLTDGQVATLVFGPQGGWHLTAGLHVWNVPQLVTLRLEIEHVDTGLLLSQSTHNVALVSPTGTWSCEGTIWGLQARIDAQLFSVFLEAIEAPQGTRPYEALCGARARLRVAVRLPGPEPIELITREVEVVVERDPNQRDAEGQPMPPCVP